MDWITTKNIVIYPLLVNLVGNQKNGAFASFFMDVLHDIDHTKTQHDLAIRDYQPDLKAFTIIKQAVLKPE